MTKTLEARELKEFTQNLRKPSTHTWSIMNNSNMNGTTRTKSSKKHFCTRDSSSKITVKSRMKSSVENSNTKEMKSARKSLVVKRLKSTESSKCCTSLNKLNKIVKKYWTLKRRVAWRDTMRCVDMNKSSWNTPIECRKKELPLSTNYTTSTCMLDLWMRLTVIKKSTLKRTKQISTKKLRKST